MQLTTDDGYVLRRVDYLSLEDGYTVVGHAFDFGEPYELWNHTKATLEFS